MSPLAITLLQVIKNWNTPLPTGKGWEGYEGPRITATGVTLVDSFMLDGKRYAWGQGEYYVWCDNSAVGNDSQPYWRYLSPDRSPHMVAQLEKEHARGL